MLIFISRYFFTECHLSDKENCTTENRDKDSSMPTWQSSARDKLHGSINTIIDHEEWINTWTLIQEVLGGICSACFFLSFASASACFHEPS